MADHNQSQPDMTAEDRALEARLSRLGEATRAEPDTGFEDRLLHAVSPTPVVESKPATASRHFWTRPAVLLAPAMAACVAVVVWLSIPGDIEPDKVIALNESPAFDRFEESADGVAETQLMDDANGISANRAASAFAPAAASEWSEPEIALDAISTGGLSYTEFELFEAELALIEAALIDLETTDQSLGFDDGWSM